MKCPNCTADVLDTNTPNLYLNPKRTRFGRYLRDGTTATATTIRTNTSAYFEHICTPATQQPTTEQPALF